MFLPIADSIGKLLIGCSGDQSVRHLLGNGLFDGRLRVLLSYLATKLDQ